MEPTRHTPCAIMSPRERWRRRRILPGDRRPWGARHFRTDQQTV